MSGNPVPMALGPFLFRGAGFGFHEQALDLQTPWAEVDVVGRLDALQWMGPKSESFGIKGVLFPEEFGGMGTLEGLKSAARLGLPLMLVTGAGAVHGMHAVFGVRETRDHIRRDGLPRRDTYEIALRRIGLGISITSGLF